MLSFIFILVLTAVSCAPEKKYIDFPDLNVVVFGSPVSSHNLFVNVEFHFPLLDCTAHADSKIESHCPTIHGCPTLVSRWFPRLAGTKGAYSFEFCTPVVDCSDPAFADECKGDLRSFIPLVSFDLEKLNSDLSKDKIRLLDWHGLASSMMIEQQDQYLMSNDYYLTSAFCLESYHLIDSYSYSLLSDDGSHLIKSVVKDLSGCKAVKLKLSAIINLFVPIKATPSDIREVSVDVHTSLLIDGSIKLVIDSDGPHNEFLSPKEYELIDKKVLIVKPDHYEDTTALDCVRKIIPTHIDFPDIKLDTHSKPLSNAVDPGHKFRFINTKCSSFPKFDLKRMTGEHASDASKVKYCPDIPDCPALSFMWLPRVGQKNDYTVEFCNYRINCVDKTHGQDCAGIVPKQFIPITTLSIAASLTLALQHHGSPLLAWTYPAQEFVMTYKDSYTMNTMVNLTTKFCLDSYYDLDFYSNTAFDGTYLWRKTVKYFYKCKPVQLRVSDIINLFVARKSMCDNAQLRYVDIKFQLPIDEKFAAFVNDDGVAEGTTRETEMTTHLLRIVPYPPSFWESWPFSLLTGIISYLMHLAFDIMLSLWHVYYSFLNVLFKDLESILKSVLLFLHDTLKEVLIIIYRFVMEIAKAAPILRFVLVYFVIYCGLISSHFMASMGLVASVAIHFAFNEPNEL